MRTKFFEIRDRATCIPALVIEMISNIPLEILFLKHAGYSMNRACYMLIMIETQECRYNSYEWNRGTRTMEIAHKFIEDNFKNLQDCDVIDVQFILGETKEPVKSDITA